MSCLVADDVKVLLDSTSPDAVVSYFPCPFVIIFSLQHLRYGAPDKLINLSAGMLAV